jgi:hypothetical protein
MGTDYSAYGSATPPSPEATGAMMTIFGGLFIFFVVFLVIFYVYMAICLMKIAKKTNTPNGWMAWIPIANVVLMLQIAKKPVWWTALLLLFFIPLINVIAGIVWLILSIIIWMAICKRLGKPEWIGVLMIVPIANLVVPGYLAFSNGVASAQSVESTPPPMAPAA